MNAIDPAAVLLLLSNLTAQVAQLQEENAQLRAALEDRLNDEGRNG